MNMDLIEATVDSSSTKKIIQTNFSEFEGNT